MMKIPESSNSNHFVFLLVVVADVFLIYNLIQYIRYGLDKYLEGLFISLGIGIVFLIYLWKNDYFPKHDNS